MRKIHLEDRTVSELEQILDNSAPTITEALTIVQAEDGEYYLIQNTNMIAEPLAVNINEDNQESLVIE